MLNKQEKIYKALSDKGRLRILKMLQLKPLCVCEITDVLKLATSTVSKHLSILREAGLIADSKDGKWVNYRLNTITSDSSILNALFSMQLLLENDDTILKDKQKTLKSDRTVLCCK